MALVGCNGGPAVKPVTGTVTLDGKPISGAVITFQPVEGGTGMPAVGTTDASGKYTVTDMAATNIGSGAVAGEYRVGVMWFKPSGKDLSQATGESGGNEEAAVATDKSAAKAAATEVSGPEALLPVDYQDPKTSGLTASVGSGDNTFDFALTSDFKGAGK